MKNELSESAQLKHIFLAAAALLLLPGLARAQTTFAKTVDYLEVHVVDAYSGDAVASCPISVAGDPKAYATDGGGIVKIAKTYATSNLPNDWIRVTARPRGYCEGFREIESNPFNYNLAVVFVIPADLFATPLVEAHVGGAFRFGPSDLPGGVPKDYALPSDFSIEISIDPQDLSHDAVVTFTPYPIWADGHSALPESTLATFKIRAIRNDGSEASLLDSIDVTITNWRPYVDLSSFSADPEGDAPFSTWEYSPTGGGFTPALAGASTYAPTAVVDTVNGTITATIPDLSNTLAIYCNDRWRPTMAWGLSHSSFEPGHHPFGPDPGYGSGAGLKGADGAKKIGLTETSPVVDWGLESTDICSGAIDNPGTVELEMACGQFFSGGEAGFSVGDTFSISASVTAAINDSVQGKAELVFGEVSAQTGHSLSGTAGGSYQLTSQVNGKIVIPAGQVINKYKCYSGSVYVVVVSKRFRLKVEGSGVPGTTFTIPYKTVAVKSLQGDFSCDCGPVWPGDYIDRFPCELQR